MTKGFKIVIVIILVCASANFIMLVYNNLSGFNLFRQFMPRAACIGYDKPIMINYFISNALISLAYFAIPLMIHLIKKNYESRTKSKIKFHHIFMAFKLFILCCGLTHVMDCIMLWRALYIIDIILLYVTAGVSIITVVILINIFTPITSSFINGGFEEEINKNLKELIQIKKLML